jgi:hypothetical protein
MGHDEALYLDYLCGWLAAKEACKGDASDLLIDPAQRAMALSHLPGCTIAVEPAYAVVHYFQLHPLATASTHTHTIQVDDIPMTNRAAITDAVFEAAI